MSFVTKVRSTAERIFRQAKGKYEGSDALQKAGKQAGQAAGQAGQAAGQVTAKLKDYAGKAATAVKDLRAKDIHVKDIHVKGAHVKGIAHK